MLEIRSLGLEGVLEIIPKRHGDARGFFVETYNAERFSQAGMDLRFVQDNHSYSAAAGVLRGLHYQLPPRAQDKLLRVIRGSDPRCRGRHSPQLAELSENGSRSKYRPKRATRSWCRRALPTAS